MIVTTNFNGVKNKQITNTNVSDYSKGIEKYLISIENNDLYKVVRRKFRTTKNAELINIFYDDMLSMQIVKSYNTYVLSCTKYVVSYTGFISQTTVKHITRFFKEYCKFDFTYEDVRK